MIKFLLIITCISVVFTEFNFDEEWTFFKQKYGKSYGTTYEELSRREIFRNNLKSIEIQNAFFAQGLVTYTLGINEYADMDTDEFVRQMNGNIPSNDTMGSTYLSFLSSKSLPDTVDWRTKGFVTGIKSQGQCGSCWAFSVTGSLEAQTFKESGKLISLSEQNLVDCDKKNHGCGGGVKEEAFMFIKENNGIDTEVSYPYEMKDETCRFQSKNVGARDTGYVKVTPVGDENALKEAVASIGPISVSMDASHKTFHLYKSGIYDDPQCSSVKHDHAVLIVGYGTQDNVDYWLVKNSWGTSWGMEGYGMMSRNKNNQCGLAIHASYPLV